MTQNTKFHLDEIKILPDILIPSKYRQSFQSAIEILAEDTNLPVVLLMRLDRGKIEIFSANTHAENKFSIGDTKELPAGLYCETVIKTKHCVIVPNVLIDETWQDFPNIPENLIAYMGLPILWPRGEVFGTVCLLNNKEHPFNDVEQSIAIAVRDAIESDLKKIYEEYCEKYHKPPRPAKITVASWL